MPVSVVLLPTQADSEQLVRLSAIFNQAQPSLIKLGGHALPHVTVAQFDAPDTACEKLWQEVRQFQNIVHRLTVGGITFLPQKNSNNLWVEAQILKSHDLSRLHEAVINTKFAAKYNSIGAVKDVYRSHCTVALYDKQIVPQIDLSAVEILRATLANWTLAVGTNGENFTFNSIVFS